MTNPLAMAVLLFSGSTATLVKQAETCLVYTGCGVEAFSVPSAEEGGYRITVSGMDDFTAQSRLAVCGLGKALQGKVTRKDGTPLALPAVDRAIVEGPAVATLGGNFLEANRAELERLTKLGMTDPAKAGEGLQALFGLKNRYAFHADPALADGVAETDHLARVIRLNPKFSTACSFWWAIRHELEHVAQIEFAGKCAGEKQRSGFLSRPVREYAAYFGDLAFSGFACEGSWLNAIENTSWSAMRRFLGERLKELQPASAPNGG